MEQKQREPNSHPSHQHHSPLLQLTLLYTDDFREWLIKNQIFFRKFLSVFSEKASHKNRIDLRQIRFNFFVSQFCYLHILTLLCCIHRHKSLFTVARRNKMAILSIEPVPVLLFVSRVLRRWRSDRFWSFLLNCDPADPQASQCPCICGSRPVRTGAVDYAGILLRLKRLLFRKGLSSPPISVFSILNVHILGLR